MTPESPTTRSRRRREEDDLVSSVRGLLVGVALGLTAVFGVALWINPYEADGSPRSHATHRQLGLPPCTFLVVTGYPCPACGMTTSFSLLARGDVANSMRANWAGTMLAAFCAAVVPWAVVSAWRGRTLFVRSIEQSLIVIVLVLLAVMLARWGVVIALLWLYGPD